MTPLDYNRYAYVRCNPVSYRDPSGHSPLAIIGALGFYATTLYGDITNWQIAGQVVLSLVMMNPDFGLNFGNGAMASAQEAAVTSLTTSYMQTGQIKRDSLESAAISALSAGVTNKIAQTGSWINRTLNIGEDFARLTAAHMDRISSRTQACMISLAV